MFSNADEAHSGSSLNDFNAPNIKLLVARAPTSVAPQFRHLFEIYTGIKRILSKDILKVTAVMGSISSIIVLG